MEVQRETDLALDHGVHQYAEDREHGQGSHPFGFLQLHGADRRRPLAPAHAQFHGRVLLLKAWRISASVQVQD
jgi:hypothetical protein